MEQGTLSDGTEIHIIPCTVSSSAWINDYRPTPTERTETERIMEKLRNLSQGLGDHNALDTLS